MLQVTDGRCYGARWRTVTRKLPQWKFRNPETQRPAYGALPPANRAYPLQHPAYGVAYSASPPASPTPQANRAYPPQPPAYRVPYKASSPAPAANRAHRPQPPAYRAAHCASSPAPPPSRVAHSASPPTPPLRHLHTSNTFIKQSSTQRIASGISNPSSKQSGTQCITSHTSSASNFIQYLQQTEPTASAFSI